MEELLLISVISYFHFGIVIFVSLWEYLCNYTRSLLFFFLIAIDIYETNSSQGRIKLEWLRFLYELKTPHEEFSDKEGIHESSGDGREWQVDSELKVTMTWNNPRLNSTSSSSLPYRKYKYTFEKFNWILWILPWENRFLSLKFIFSAISIKSQAMVTRQYFY